MCDVCGCGDAPPPAKPARPRLAIEVHENLLGHNDETAAHLRVHFQRAGLTTINLMGSPGAHQVDEIGRAHV